MAKAQVTALEGTVEALRSAGSLSDLDEAVVSMASGLAEAVDADPTNAALWREYRAALTALKEAGADGSDDDTQEFIVSVQTPRRTKVGDPAKP